MVFSGINYLAIPLAAIAGMITGAIWYGVFAKQWMKAVGFTEEDVQQKASLYIVAVIAQVVIAYMMAGIIGHLGEVTVASGVISAAFCWLGFCVAPMAVNHRFQDKGWDLTLIDGGFWLVVFLLQGAIIGWMGV
ncbi:MAG: DUF1761 domain-containing protein [Pseudomonadota bacterium]